MAKDFNLKDLDGVKKKPNSRDRRRARFSSMPPKLHRQIDSMMPPVLVTPEEQIDGENNNDSCDCEDPGVSSLNLASEQRSKSSEGISIKINWDNEDHECEDPDSGLGSSLQLDAIPVGIIKQSNLEAGDDSDTDSDVKSKLEQNNNPSASGNNKKMPTDFGQKKEQEFSEPDEKNNDRLRLIFMFVVVIVLLLFTIFILVKNLLQKQAYETEIENRALALSSQQNDIITENTKLKSEVEDLYRQMQNLLEIVEKNQYQVDVLVDLQTKHQQDIFLLVDELVSSQKKTQLQIISISKQRPIIIRKNIEVESPEAEINDNSINNSTSDIPPNPFPSPTDGSPE